MPDRSFGDDIALGDSADVVSSLYQKAYVVDVGTCQIALVGLSSLDVASHSIADLIPCLAIDDMRDGSLSDAKLSCDLALRHTDNRQPENGLGICFLQDGIVILTSDHAFI